MWKYLVLLFPASVCVVALQWPSENEFGNMYAPTGAENNHWVLGELERPQDLLEQSWESVGELGVYSNEGDLAEIHELAPPGHYAEISRQQAQEDKILNAAGDIMWKSRNEPEAFISRNILCNISSKEIYLQDMVSEMLLDSAAPEEKPFEDAGEVSDKRRHRRYIGDGHMGKTFRKLPNSTVTLVHCEQLMILKEEDSNGNLYGCTLSKRLFTPEKQRSQLAKWRSLADLVLVEKSVDTFMDLVDSCLKTEKSNISKTWTFKTVLKAIAPGTLWCGNNQLVTDLNQLGAEWKVDQCCRLHDLCPLQLPSLRVYKGLLSFGPLMMSHCACDNRFDRCLNKVKTLGARGIFHVYFNILYRTRNCVSDELLAGRHTLHYKPFDWFTRMMNFIKSVFEFRREVKYASLRREVMNTNSREGKENTFRWKTI